MARSAVVSDRLGSDAVDRWRFLTGRAIGRIALSTILLIVLGAAGGAVTTVLAFWAFSLTSTPADFVPFTSLADARFVLTVLLIFGAAVGTACGPVAGWLFLRRVPLWRAVAEPAAAAIFAAALGGLFSMGATVPCAVGAFWVAAARLGWSHRRSARSSPGPRLGAGAR